MYEWILFLGKKSLCDSFNYTYLIVLVYIQYLLVKYLDLHFPYKKSFHLPRKALLLLFILHSSLFLFSMNAIQIFILSDYVSN